MKLLKTLLRTQLNPTNLENRLYISTETPNDTSFIIDILVSLKSDTEDFNDNVFNISWMN